MFPKHRKSVEAIRDRFVKMSKGTTEYFSYLRRAIKSGAANLDDCDLKEVPEFFDVFQACGAAHRPVQNPPAVANGGGFYQCTGDDNGLPRYRKTAFVELLGVKLDGKDSHDQGVFATLDLAEEDTLDNLVGAAAEKLKGQGEREAVDVDSPDEEEPHFYDDPLDEDDCSEREDDSDCFEQAERQGDEHLPAGCDKRIGGKGKPGQQRRKKPGPKSAKEQREALMAQINASLDKHKTTGAGGEGGDEVAAAINGLATALTEEGDKNRQHDSDLQTRQENFMDKLLNTLVRQ
jgi:hypothetical protein